MTRHDHPASPDQNVLLIGLRGSGKSTVGALLADALGLGFLDLDTAALDRLGASTVAQAWSRFGESTFRDAEVDCLRQALSRKGVVIAAGGGTPTAPGAARMIRRMKEQNSVRVVYLRCSPVSLRRRLRQSATSDPDRPSLTGADPLDEIEAVFAARDPLYRSLACAVIDAEEPARSVARAVISLFQEGNDQA